MTSKMYLIYKRITPLVILCFGISLCFSNGYSQEGLPGSGKRSTVLFIPIQRGPDVPEGVPGRVEEYFKALMEIDPKIKLISLGVEDLPPEPVEIEPVTITDIQSTPTPQPTVSVQPQTHPDLEKAKKLAESGIDAVKQRRYDKGLGLLLQAKNLLAKHLDKLEDFGLFVDVHLYIAVGFYEGGYLEEAPDAINKLVAIKPDISPDRSVASKKFLDALESAKIKNRVGGPISIVVSPENATVYVDGRVMGTGSQSTGEIAKGTHYIKVTAEGMQTQVRSVTNSGPGKTTTVTIALKPLGTPVASPQPVKKVSTSAPKDTKPKPLTWYVKTGDFGPLFVRDAKAVADKLLADYILMAYLARSEKTLHFAIFIFDVKSGDTVGIEPSIIDTDLGNLQIALLDLESRVSNAITMFPRDRIVKGKPAVYSITPKKPTQPPAMVTASPPPQPQVTETPSSSSQPPVQPIPSSPPPTQVITYAPPVAPALPVRPSVPVGGFDEIPPDFPMETMPIETAKPWYKKWWIWTLTGAVIASAAIGTTLMVMKKGGGTSTFSGTAVISQ